MPNYINRLYYTKEEISIMYVEARIKKNKYQGTDPAYDQAAFMVERRVAYYQERENKLLN